MTITPESAQVRLGQPLRLAVRVQNAGSMTATLPYGSGCRTDFELLSSAGEYVTSSMQMCTAMMSTGALAAGGSFSETLVWIPGARGTLAPTPGRYQLRGVLLRLGAPVRSAPVPVEVLPA